MIASILLIILGVVMIVAGFFSAMCSVSGAPGGGSLGLKTIHYLSLLVMIVGIGLVTYNLYVFAAALIAL